MSRLGIVMLVAFSILGAGMSVAQAGQVVHNMRIHKYGVCHSKIDPKQLKGDVAKAEWKKCLESPDMYQ